MGGEVASRLASARLIVSEEGGTAVWMNPVEVIEELTEGDSGS